MENETDILRFECTKCHRRYAVEVPAGEDRGLTWARVSGLHDRETNNDHHWPFAFLGSRNEEAEHKKTCEFFYY